MLKSFSTIGCCGIDCGLCPRYYTRGESACPGCGAKDFREKHPACGFLTCCAINREFETCADCHEYPCKRYDNENKGFDSFVTHQRVFPNLNFIRDNGLALFLNQQNKRMEILSFLLIHFDDGRSKSFFCLTCALLPVDELEKIRNEFVGKSGSVFEMKNRISQISNSLNLTLKLRKPST